MELVFNNKENCPSKIDILKTLLHPFQRALVKEPIPNSSIYPIFRLLFPDIDSGRAVNYGMKESVIADIWINANDLDPQSTAAQTCTGYKDPSKAGTAAGDLPKAIFSVLEKRMPNEPSSITVGTFNSLLDTLASFNIKKAVLGSRPEFGHNHNSEGVRTRSTEARFDQHYSKNHHDIGRLSHNVETHRNPYDAADPRNAPPKKTKTAKQRRIEWVRDLSSIHKMGPVEQKWIIKILICKMQLGITAEGAMSFVHPDMVDLFGGSQNLELVCAQVADRNFLQRRKEAVDRQIRESGFGPLVNGKPAAGRYQFTGDVKVGRLCSPMLADRTDFKKLIR